MAAVFGDVRAQPDDWMLSCGSVTHNELSAGDLLRFVQQAATPALPRGETFQPDASHPGQHVHTTVSGGIGLGIWVREDSGRRYYEIDVLLPLLP